MRKNDCERIRSEVCSYDIFFAEVKQTDFKKTSWILPIKQCNSREVSIYIVCFACTLIWSMQEGTGDTQAVLVFYIVGEFNYLEKFVKYTMNVIN